MPRKATFDPVLFEKLFRKSQEYAKESKKNIDITEKWFIIAKNDIEISELLFKKKHFAGAIYHLQQAFEKLIKGYYILSGRIRPEDAKSHFFVLKKLQSEIKDEYINTFLELTKSIKDNKINLDSADTALNNIEKSEDEIRLMNKENLNTILNLISKIESVIISVDMVEKAEEKLQEKSFIKMLKHLIFQITTYRVREKDVKEAIKKEQVIFYLKSAVISIKLQLICLFTFLHFNSPRYPTDPKTNVSFFDYQKNLGIVSILPDLIKIFNEIYEELISEVKRIKELK